MACLASSGATGLRRAAAAHATMLDLLSGAVCSPDEIRVVAEQLFEGGQEYLPF